MTASDTTTLRLDILFENLRAAKQGKALPNQVDPHKGY